MLNISSEQQLQLNIWIRVQLQVRLDKSFCLLLSYLIHDDTIVKQSTKSVWLNNMKPP
jgi:hypothetical protein